MERNANYALVGAISLALFMALIIFVVWLARLSFNKDYDIYDVLFVGPVRGISEGGEVHLNGIKVGEVSKISLDPTDPNRVIARVRVTSDVPIKTDSFATLEPQGITGVNYIQITAGSTAQPLLKVAWKDKPPPVIKTQSSALSDLLQGGGNVLTRAVEALDRVNKVLSDQNIKTLTASLSDVQAVTAELRERKSVIADADKALQSIDETAQSFKALSESGRQLVDNDGKRTFKQLGDAADQLNKAATDARQVVDKLEGPATDFATNGLPQLTSAVVSMQNAADSVNRLVGQVEQNPRGLVAKPPAQEVQVKP